MLNLNRTTCLKVQIVQAGTRTIMADYWYSSNDPIPRVGEYVQLSLIPEANMAVMRVTYKFEAGIIEVLVA